MSIRINNFIANLTGGGARASLFEVFCINPINNQGDEKMRFTAKAAQLPGIEQGVIETAYMGRRFKLAGDKNFPEWTVTILNDEDFLVRNAMEQWTNAIQGNDSNVRGGGATSNPASYKSDVYVRQYGKDESLLREYKLVGAFPSVVSPIDNAWESSDTIQEYDITFNYDWWEVSGGNTGNAGGSNLGSVL